jgi:hypothetical protein
MMNLPPTVAPTMAIANSRGMLGREYPGSHCSAKQLGGRASMTALFMTNAFPKQEDTTFCKERSKLYSDTDETSRKLSASTKIELC